MNLSNASGFCDLNICVSEPNTKEMVIQALKLGYETIALSRYISDEVVTSKKNKKGSYAEIPAPPICRISNKELQKHGLTTSPKIFSRLTIQFSEPSSPFLHKSKDVILKYDIIAYKPLTEAAFKHLCQASVDVDLISFDTCDALYRPSRKLLNLAIKRDIYFELCYAPCLRTAHSRQRTLQLAHDLHSLSRSINVVITSGATTATELRRPYDVANLGLLFGLTPAASKAAVAKTTCDLVHCAWLRRSGASKCAAQVQSLEESSKKGKFDSLFNLEKFLEDGT